MKTITKKDTLYRLKNWDSINFEIRYSNSGVARIYINGDKTSFCSGGYGYCKESDLLAKFINFFTIDDCKYNKNYYGNYKGKKLSQGGVGFNSIKKSFESKRGNKLIRLYWSDCFDIYKLSINSKHLKEEV